MVIKKIKKEYYRALLDKNIEYEGVFFVGVKTTGGFCRPTCPARKPKNLFNIYDQDDLLL